MLETGLLRRVIHYIWECYRDRGEMKIRLKNHKGDELHVEEEAEEYLVTVRSFAKQETGELVKQMEVLCVILRHGEWIPLALYQDDTSLVYGIADADTGYVEIHDRTGQSEAAGFCDAWALRLLAEGFLATAAKQYPLRSRRTHRPNWPQPTAPAPSLEQIEDWVWEDGGCEATDSCWVEVDGVCPHGHPSCAPRSVSTQSSREEPKNGVS